MNGAMGVVAPPGMVALGVVAPPGMVALGMVALGVVAPGMVDGGHGRRWAPVSLGGRDGSGVIVGRAARAE